MRAIILFFLLSIILSSCGLENGVQRGYIISEVEKTDSSEDTLPQK